MILRVYIQISIYDCFFNVIVVHYCIKLFAVFDMLLFDPKKTPQKAPSHDLDIGNEHHEDIGFPIKGLINDVR